MTERNQLNDFDDDNALRGALRFTVENALKILETERKHLGEITEQCAPSPISADKSRQGHAVYREHQVGPEVAAAAPLTNVRLGRRARMPRQC
jgi:hypothetical protein